MASENESDKAEETKVIGGRATPEQIRLIDLAAAIEETDRGPFLVDTAYRAAVDVITRKAPQLLEHIKQEASEAA